MPTTRTFRHIARTALLFAVIASLLFLLLAPHANHANGHHLPWLCLAPYLLFAPDFRRTLPITGSTVQKHHSPAIVLLSRFQLPPPAHTS